MDWACFVVLFFSIMPVINLGPATARVFVYDNYTSLELAWVSNRFGGMARRETAIRGSFKSDHILEAVGKDNPADTFTCPDTGVISYGKIMEGPGGVYTLSAKEVYTKSLFTRAVKAGLRSAEDATNRVEATTSQAAPEPVAA